MHDALEHNIFFNKFIAERQNVPRHQGYRSHQGHQALPEDRRKKEMGIRMESIGSIQLYLNNTQQMTNLLSNLRTSRSGISLRSIQTAETL